MTEELQAFLKLGRKRQSSPEDLRKIVSVLHTMEAYMTKTDWKVYETLKGKVVQEGKERKEGDVSS